MTTNAPHGANNAFSPDMLARQVLQEGLVLLAADPVRMADLFARFDSLFDGSQDEQPAAWRDRLRGLVSYGGVNAVQIGLGYPHDDMVLPYVGIVLDSGSEARGQARHNDLQAVTHELVGEDEGEAWTQRCVQHRHRQTDWSSRVQVSTWATTAEESLLLHEAVRDVFMHDKGRLRPAGVTDITLSDTGFAPDVQMRPRVVWVPMLSISMEWDLQQRARRRVPSRALVTPTFSN